MLASQTAQGIDTMSGNTAEQVDGQNNVSISDLQEAWLLVDLNNQRLNETVLFVRANEQLLVSREDLIRWRVRLPAQTPFMYRGAAFFSLASLSGLTYQLDERTQTVDIIARPDMLTPSVYRYPEPHYLLAQRNTGGFLNYDLSAVKTTYSATQSGFFELGFFNPAGAGNHNFIIQNPTGQVSMTRLSTTWITDTPEALRSLRVGDALSQPGYWGSPVNFAGIQYATNFSTQPRFIRFPRQLAFGETLAPSTVDVFINNTRVLQQNVPPGPFAITDIPRMTGQGEMRMVVKDVLGREQVITQNFYSSEALLRPGLIEYSFDAGFARKNFGIESNHYAQPLAAATYRTGLTEFFTGELRSELSDQHSTAGIGGNYLVTNKGTLDGSIALSESSAGSGSLIMAGFVYQSEHFSSGLHSQFATRSFTRQGLAPGLSAPGNITSLNLGLTGHHWGAAGLTCVLQDNREQGKVKIGMINYSVPLLNSAQLNLVAIRSLGVIQSLSLNMIVSFPLGERTSASVSQKRTLSATTSTGETGLQIQQSAPMGNGWGYQVLASDTQMQRGSLTHQTRIGSYGIDVSTLGGNTSTRMNAAGGVGFLGEKAFFMRPITGSFGVVKVNDYKDVRVYVDNQLIGRTDKAGYALLPYLRPYDLNGITVEQEDLPLNAEIDILRINAAPYYRSGIFLDFPIRPSHGATLTAVFENNKPVPAGATVRIQGRNDVFPVALHGEIYVTGLSRDNILELSWQEKSCQMHVPFAPSKDPLPALGTFICKPH